MQDNACIRAITVMALLFKESVVVVPNDSAVNKAIFKIKIIYL